MTEHVTLSRKELDRLQIMTRIAEKRLTRTRAAEFLSPEIDCSTWAVVLVVTRLKHFAAALVSLLAACRSRVGTGLRHCICHEGSGRNCANLFLHLGCR